MNCPKCNVTLLMSEKQGVEIDYCPQCRGIWLDRGELEKIIEKSYSQDNQSGSYYRHNDHHDSYEHGKYGKKRNFLSDLFD